MAATTSKTQCFICGKEKNTYSCKGCYKDFCFNHLTEHRQILSQQFDEIEYHRDEFLQIIIEEKQNTKDHSLIQHIDKWENDSIQKIKQTAEQCRQTVIEYTKKFIIEIENKLNQLTDQMREIRQENEFNELDLDQLKTKLIKLREELEKSSNVSIKEDSTLFINKISIEELDCFNNIDANRKWKQNGVTVAGGNGKGNKLNQLSQPCGIYVDDDQTIYIVDCDNHRIIEWKSNAKTGQVVAGGNGRGTNSNQLNRPSDIIIDKKSNSLIIADRQNNRVVRWSRQNSTNGQVIISGVHCLGLTMDNNGDIYVSDTEKHEVRKWKIGENHGTIVAGGNGKGNSLNQFNFPSSIFVDEDYSLYVTDRNNHRVMKWIKNAKEGIIVAGGNGEGNSLTQLPSPQGMIINRLGHIYVAESGNNRVMRWCKEATQGSIVVGGNGQGDKLNQFNGSIDLAFDGQGNLYVSDYWNHRIQKFEIDLH